MKVIDFFLGILIVVVGIVLKIYSNFSGNRFVIRGTSIDASPVVIIVGVVVILIFSAVKLKNRFK
ncbi:MAG: hypothetical protein ACP5FK_04695 [bacterium]